MEFTIERTNLNISRNINVEYLSDNTSLFLIDSYGVSNNEDIRDIPMIENENWISLEDIETENRKETYCYVKIHTLNDIRKQYKLIHITHILVDEDAINPKIFEHIFRIFFKQEDSTFNNRLFLGNREYKFSRNSFQYAKDAAEYVFGLYVSFTNSLSPKYTFPYRPLILQ